MPCAVARKARQTLARTALVTVRIQRLAKTSTTTPLSNPPRTAGTIQARIKRLAYQPEPVFCVTMMREPKRTVLAAVWPSVRESQNTRKSWLR